MQRGCPRWRHVATLEVWYQLLNPRLDDVYNSAQPRWSRYQGISESAMKNLPMMRRKWHALFRGWDIDAIRADQTFEAVRQRYSESGRFYHTLDHVQSVLKQSRA